MTGGTAESADDGFVIEELSRRTGMTVRSLRSYQSRKLLPPPTVRGRTGYYDERHVARIQLIQNLQSEGIKLHSIARMLDEGGRSDADLLQFTRSVQTMFTESDGSITTVGDLAGRFGVEDLEAGRTCSSGPSGSGWSATWTTSPTRSSPRG